MNLVPDMVLLSHDSSSDTETDISDNKEESNETEKDVVVSSMVLTIGFYKNFISPLLSPGRSLSLSLYILISQTCYFHLNFMLSYLIGMVCLYRLVGYS